MSDFPCVAQERGSKLSALASTDTQFPLSVVSKTLNFIALPWAQDLAGVELAKKMLADEPKDPIIIPEGFVRIVQVRPARGTATQA